MLHKLALWHGWFRRLALSFLLIGVFSSLLPAQDTPSQESQEAAAPETPTTGTIQGTVKDADGNAIQTARVLFRSKTEGTSSVARTGKDGVFTSEALVPGDYTITVEAANFQIAEARTALKAGLTATADFKLEPINPGPSRLESRASADRVDELPINGRHPLQAARLEPGVQVVDGAILDPGKTGYQALSIDSRYGRTVHYDFDEVEAMDETKGAAIANLPTEGVRELIVNRSVPEVFQSLNAAGSVRLVTRSGADEWHGDLFGRYSDARAGWTGFNSATDPKASRQQYGFGVGGAVIKEKGYLFFGVERVKQDGQLPIASGFPILGYTVRDASFRENMLTGRFDYQLSENAKWFYRYSYDNADEFGGGFSKYRNQINVPSHVFGLDWNRGHFAHSARFGYQKLVDALNPAFGLDAGIVPGIPFHFQIGSFDLAPSTVGPRQTIQRDIFGRYDGSTPFRDRHTLRFGGAVRYITQRDFFLPGAFGPSVTSSNGKDVIDAIFNDPNPPFPGIPGDARGAAGNPLNYPVGTITIYNGLGNFSEHSAFNHSAGGHTDTRIELYAADTFKLYPNLSIFVGVNYARDTNRTNSDLGSISALDQFGEIKGLGNRVTQPNWNFAPQAGIAWDPGRHGRTVFRASGGMFYDNFLWQNSYQDRISRLAQGQYFRSLTLCPSGRVLFPDGSLQSSIDGLDIATQICGQPVGNVATAIQDLQAQFVANQQAVTSGPNAYALANTGANFGGLLAPNFRTPRVVHMSAGLQRQLGERSSFSIDYVRQIGTQFPLGIDTNHVGDASHLDSAAALKAIEATVQGVNPTVDQCLIANNVIIPGLTAGSQSQAAVNCYIAGVPGASITDFARHGLDSSNSYCGPFPCSALGLNNAAFSGINPAVGSNVMYFPSGRTQYTGVHLEFKTSSDLHARGLRHWDLGIAYTYSKYQSNVAMADGAGGDVSLLSRAEDYNRPHVGHFGPSGLDRRNMFTFTPSFELIHGARLTILTQLLSPLPLTARLPQLNGGGVAGEIFRTDATGDGTVGDILPGTSVGGLGGYSGNDLSKALGVYNTNYAGRLTFAGNALASQNGTTPPLFTSDQLRTLGAVYPFICAVPPNQVGCQSVPGRYAQTTWLKTIDLRLSWPFQVGERVRIEPNVAAFNVANFANFGGAGRQLNGVLDGSPGTSLNNASSPGFCGNSSTFCTSRLDRVVPGSGTYAIGAPRQLEFGVRITF